MFFRPEDGVDAGGDPLQRRALQFRLEVVFLAVGHAALAVDRAALGEAAGLVGDHLADLFGPHFHDAAGVFEQMGFLLRVISRIAEFHGPNPSKIGNHDERIARAIEYQPELEGMISYKDLELSKNYDVVVDYEGRTPGSIEIDGIQYGHYFPSGIMGRPISGDVRPAHSLLLKRHVSTTQAHTHTLDWATQTKGDGTKIMGLFAGCFLDYEPDYAGSTSDMWWRGVVIKHEVENGVYDPEFISLERLKKLYDTGND